MRIEHLIFLIHPGCYRGVAERDPEQLRKENLGAFLAKEQEVTKRWIAAAEVASQSTLLLQLYGDASLFEELKSRLSEARACYVRAELPADSDLREYYRRLTACIREHMARFDLSMDVEQVISELWGESFEGCVPGYGGAFAVHLGLKRPPTMRFEMTVPDVRFALTAKPSEILKVKNSDVEAWLFECADGAPAAIFQARLHEQWLDERSIHLKADPARVQVCTTTGHTVWPEQPWRKGDPAEPQSCRITPKEARWLCAPRLSVEDFRQMIASAVVEEPSK